MSFSKTLQSDLAVGDDYELLGVFHEELTLAHAVLALEKLV
jgi:hypothetical protein